MNGLQLSFIPDGTPEQNAAIGLHYEILAAAQAAVETIASLGGKLKQMRDSEGYKLLGFETFDAYTTNTVGLRQRQAYNYINIVEKVSPTLIEENAGAGITKLALLAKLTPAEQEEVAQQDIKGLTVEELKQQVEQLTEERNGLSEQLSLLQEEKETTPAAIEAKVVDVDIEEKIEEAREEAQREAQAEIESMEQQMSDMQREHVAALMKAAAEKEEIVKNAGKEAREKLKQEKEKALEKQKKELEQGFEKQLQQLQQEKEQAVAAEADRQKAAMQTQLEAQQAKTEQALHEIEDLKLASDPDSARFSFLFEQLQQTAADMAELAQTMQQNGKREQATKLKGALAGGLRALAESVMQ